MERYPVTAHDGSTLSAFGKSTRNIRASSSINGATATITFEAEIGRNPNFSRGITKIALSALAYFHGVSNVLSDDFDPVRKYGKRRVGNSSILMVSGRERWRER